MNEFNIVEFPYYVGEIPFYYTNLDVPHNILGIPDKLSFTLDYDHSTGTLIQSRDEKNLKILNKAYNYGSQITGYMDDYELGEKYAKDFFEFIIKNEKRLNECKILEIGCGTGYLLSLLKKIGGDVVGIEPGKQAEIGKNKYGVNIIKDFYPTQEIKENFDIIIFYNVLEHISDIKNFLLNVKRQLKDDGRIYFAVPDCEKNIEHGDISMLIHEHFNYFTKTSLSNTIIKYLGYRAHMEKSCFGAELYGLVINNKEFSVNDLKLDNIHETYNNYIKKVIDKISKFKDFLIEVNRCGKSLGIYVPSRAINILSLVKDSVNLKNIKFFDDNSNLVGTYFPGVDIIIKSQKELINSPTEYVLIMSYTFGNVIKDNIIEKLPVETKIIIYDELL